MLLSSLSFFIVQGIAFKYLANPELDSLQISEEYPFALAGFIVCTIGLLAYCIYQMFVPKLAQQRAKKLLEQRELRNMRLKALYILTHFRDLNILREDTIRARALHFSRVWKAKALAKKQSTNIQGSETHHMQPVMEAENDPLLGGDGHDDDDEEPEEDPREHFWKNLCISLALMIGGTAIVGVFSDPMVDTITTLGFLWGIPAFYVSFILTPFCSNASELVASLAFAAKKRVANTSMTYSQLYGAVIMNNTMGLGIFFALIAFRGLEWKYTAETLSILFVILLVGIPASFKKSFSLWWVFGNAPLYPLSIALVYILEQYAHWA